MTRSTPSKHRKTKPCVLKLVPKVLVGDLVVVEHLGVLNCATEFTGVAVANGFFVLHVFFFGRFTKDFASKVAGLEEPYGVANGAW